MYACMYVWMYVLSMYIGSMYEWMFGWMHIWVGGPPPQASILRLPPVHALDFYRELGSSALLPSRKLAEAHRFSLTRSSIRTHSLALISATIEVR